MPRIYEEIPAERPATPLLDQIDTPQQLRELAEKDLRQLADELRLFLLWSGGRTGGHFAAGLGVIELTAALHFVFETPVARLVWGAGHQAYPLTILTHGREPRLATGKKAGSTASPKRQEGEAE